MHTNSDIFTHTHTHTHTHTQKHTQANNDVELQAIDARDFEIGAGRFSKVYRREVDGGSVAVKVSSRIMVAKVCTCTQ